MIQPQTYSQHGQSKLCGAGMGKRALTSFSNLPKYWWSSGLSSGRPSSWTGTSNFCPCSSSGKWYSGVPPIGVGVPISLRAGVLMGAYLHIATNTLVIHYISNTISNYITNTALRVEEHSGRNRQKKVGKIGCARDERTLLEAPRPCSPLWEAWRPTPRLTETCSSPQSPSPSALSATDNQQALAAFQCIPSCFKPGPLNANVLTCAVTGSSTAHTLHKSGSAHLVLLCSERDLGQAAG